MFDAKMKNVYKRLANQSEQLISAKILQHKKSLRNFPAESVAADIINTTGLST